MLAELLPSSLFQGSRFGKPTLAMLGGFSAGVVQRLVETLETMVKGSGDPGAAAATELRANAVEQRTRINSEAAAQLVELTKGLDQADGKAAAAEINKRVKRLLGDGAG